MKSNFKIYKVREEYYQRKSNLDIYNDCGCHYDGRGQITLKEYPHAFLMIEFDDRNTGKIIRTGAAGLEVGTAFRTKYVEEDRFNPEDEWQFNINISLLN